MYENRIVLKQLKFQLQGLQAELMTGLENRFFS